MKQQYRVPFHRPSIGQGEIDEVVTTLESGWLTSGPRTARLEQEFRDWVEAEHAVAVSSGTAALHLSLAALGIGPGDEVITTPLTFCATVHAIAETGAEAVLADVGDDGNLDPESVRSRIGARTRAIMPVHLGGLPCNMGSLWALARERSLFVIEDAAHAAGSCYEGRLVGASYTEDGAGSDAIAFSFYVTKSIAAGEGGMVTTPHSALARTMRLMRLHGIDRDVWNRESWRYDVVLHGFKYNLSDLHAAVALRQLRRSGQLLEARRRYATLYRDLLGDIEEIALPPAAAEGEHSWHLFILRLHLEKLDIDRDEFVRRLAARGVEASVHFIPIPLHTHFAPLAKDPRNRCPKANDLFRRSLSIPLYPAMTLEQLKFVSSAVRDVVGTARKTRTMAARI